MKITTRIFCALILTTTLTSAANAEIIKKLTDTLEVGTSGYGRIGGGNAISASDDERVCFQAPGAGAKYRLGNECDTYVEVFGSITYRPEGAEGPYFKFEGGPSFGGQDWESPEIDRWAQAYGEVSGGKDFLGGAKLWFGRRFYDRHDIHMNDYFWLNMSRGQGGGIRDIDVGLGKLDYALLRDKQFVDMDNDGSASGPLDVKTYQTNHDLRWHDIPVNEDGKLLLWLNYATAPDIQRGGLSYDPPSGHAVGIVHTQSNFFGGFNKVAVQYGRGLGRNLNTVGLAESQAGISNVNNADIFRFVENALIVPNEDWSVMGTFIWEERDGRDFDGSEQRWVSVGVRPYYNFTDNIRAGAEIGMDYVDNKATNVDGTLMKYTMDVEWAPSRDFFSRPSVRAYVTHANWSDSWRGAVGGPTHATDTSGTNIGIQLEYWW